MLASEIIDNVRTEVLEVSANFWSEAELLRLLNRGLQHYVNQTRMLESYSFLTTTPGVRRYVLPSTALSVKFVMFKRISEEGDTSWKILELTTLERMAHEFNQFLETTTEFQGEPTAVAVYDRTLELDRPPNRSTDSDLFIFFKSKPVNVPTVDSHIPIDDVAVEGLIQFVLWKAWMKEKEIALAKEAKSEYELEIRKGRMWVKQQMAMLRHRMDIDTHWRFTNGRSKLYNPLEL